MTEQMSEDIFGLGGAASEATEDTSHWLREHFKLPYNPFPPSGISPDTPAGPPLKDQEGREIKELIRDFINSAYKERTGPRGLVIIGTYGTGKSHLLRLMHNQINEWLGSGEEKALSIYVQRPRIEAQDLNREILRSLGEDTVRKMLWFCIRQEIAKDIKDKSEMVLKLGRDLVGPLFSQKQNWDSVEIFQTKNLEDYRNFLKAYDAYGRPREKLREYFNELFNRALAIESPLEVVQAFVALLLAPDERARATWESLLALGRSRKVPLMAAPEFLKGLLRLIEKNGYVYTFLLIDEFEEVPLGYLLTKRQRADYMYTLMEMLNKIQEGLGLVLAITPEAWAFITEEATPLQDRLPKVIRLGALDAESIKRLIKFYLDRARQDGDIKSEDPLIPFSEKLIDEIASNLLEPTTRNTLQFAHQLISHCVAHKVTTITSEIIRAVLKDYKAMKAIETQRRLGRR